MTTHVIQKNQAEHKIVKNNIKIITIEWILFHMRIQENETADELVKKGNKIIHNLKTILSLQVKIKNIKIFYQ